MSFGVFARRILERQPRSVYADDEPTRDRVSVGDVARANVLAMQAPIEVYNIGTEVDISLNQLSTVSRHVVGHSLVWE
jgi:UDP-glucose 4-epimerase